tara:strand:+ start:249 stop:932 length:684 start_codon:yes stop_codon:yes gene_type:complete
MATVRISQTLRDDIIDNARTLFTDRKRQAKENYSKDWGKQIRSELYPSDVIQKINTLDKSWFHHGDTITLNGFVNTPDEVIQKKYNLEVKFDVDSFPYPNDFTMDKQYGYMASSSYGGISISLDATNPKWDNIQKEYKVYRQAIYDIEQEEDTIVSTIKKVLNNYSTLSPCLKALPKLYELLPQHTKNRHNQIIEKAEKIIPEELDIDTSSLDVAMVKDKITKGGNK